MASLSGMVPALGEVRPRGAARLNCLATRLAGLGGGTGNLVVFFASVAGDMGCL
jgi:hypothetical protein